MLSLFSKGIPFLELYPILFLFLSISVCLSLPIASSKKYLWNTQVFEDQISVYGGVPGLLEKVGSTSLRTGFKS